MNFLQSTENREFNSKKTVVFFQKNHLFFTIILAQLLFKKAKTKEGLFYIKIIFSKITQNLKWIHDFFYNLVIMNNFPL